MKSLLLLLFTVPFFFHHPNKNDAVLANELAGQWKKIAAGEDANKNRILEESEKMKPEPTSQDILHLNSDGKCKVTGMAMELEGTWLTKNYSGKKTLFIYTADIMDLPQEERDKSAMRFEIVSLQNGKLVVIPPIFISMLAIYTRTK
jgi:hypothetical protein